MQFSSPDLQTDTGNNLNFFIDEVLLFWETESLLKTGHSIHPTKTQIPYKSRKNSPHSTLLPTPSPTIPKFDTDKMNRETSKVTTVKKAVQDRSDNLTNWPLQPLTVDETIEDFLKVKFKCLKHKSLSPLRIPAAVILFSPSSSEILFFQRLTKAATQFLFPCRLLVLNEKNTDIKMYFQRYEILLLKIELTNKLFSGSTVHEPHIHDGTTIIPILSHECYQEDPEAKKKLWTQLNQLPTSAMLKS